MANREKIEAAGIKKNNKEFLYYIKGGRVYRVHKKGHGSPKSQPEVAYQGEIKQDPDYIYFVDEDGDIARVPRARGGRKPTARAARSGGKGGTAKPPKLRKSKQRPVTKAAKKPKSKKKQKKKPKKTKQTK
jgi:hypothetical protein